MKHAQALLISVIISLLPVEAKAVLREITAEWEYPQIENVAGFRLYQEGSPVCSTNNPQATSMNCTIDAPDGEFRFTLTVLFEDGTESPRSEPLSYIFSTDLTARFIADPLQGESPLSVSFDAAGASGNIISYEWMFGDGEFGTGSMVNHIFTSSGSYTVTLKVTDYSGATDQDQLDIAVTSPTTANIAPVAVVASSAGIGSAPLPVDFDGTESYDSDGTILTFTWDFGDGGAAEGSLADYLYLNAGTFSSSLTVKDDGGLSDTASTPILVEPSGGDNVEPTAVINVSKKSGRVPLSIGFNGGNSSDADGTIVEYFWNFGDGATAAGERVSHTFVLAADYEVTLEVTDNAGAVSTPAVFMVRAVETETEEIEEDDRPRSTPLPAIEFLLRFPEEAEQRDPNEEGQ